jgi:hypothetical protein
MNRILATVTLSLALIISGVVHGRWTDRWSSSPALAEAAKRLEKVPDLVIGDWTNDEFRQGHTTPDPLIAGTVQRSFKRSNNQEIVVTLVCGRPGPVSIHSPDVCYAASGFKVGTPERYTVPGTNATFWTATATLTKATDVTSLRIFWAWNCGDGWTASDNPRLAYARKPVLHKLYVVRAQDHLNESLADDPCQGFMQDLLRELDPTLFKQGL